MQEKDIDRIGDMMVESTENVVHGNEDIREVSGWFRHRCYTLFKYLAGYTQTYAGKDIVDL